MMADIPSGSGSEDCEGVRLVVLNLPEDEGEGLGFRLTRTLWDPYPWVREVTPGARADLAGLKTGDCLLQADGKDLLGLPVGQVAGLIRGDGAGHGVSLLVWNCGVDPKDDPELLWSCGGGSRGEKSRRALAGVVKALSCCVCAATATKALNCARSHLYCEACWKRLERCALCREALPPKDSPYARNLVAEQVFEAIATEYEIKDAIKKPSESASAYASPNRSPNMSSAAFRRGQYHLSAMRNRKTVQFVDKYKQNYASDPNIHRSLNQDSKPTVENSTTETGRKTCDCQQSGKSDKVPEIRINGEQKSQKCCQSMLQHSLIARARQACSLVDLQAAMQSCALSKSLNNINTENCNEQGHHSGSLDNLKINCKTTSDMPLYVLSAPPIYVLTCDHNKNE
ncbi:uncharacterized protein LOC133532573 [Cydia pomonella]|uniref:uncharacterized protein LOC133532573 n=1 Tax=Cydia pomonella TaxID=82600 RepID=UPI002ADD3362|nr:uncharacterized protein LOC133532573 [Cydia pomonella]XP_061727300.1 uncharacterized protein LOC133532573 [Cydia pomonella]